MRGKKKERRKRVVGSRSWLQCRHALTWERTASKEISLIPRKVLIEARRKLQVLPKWDNLSDMLARVHVVANSKMIYNPTGFETLDNSFFQKKKLC